MRPSKMRGFYSFCVHNNKFGPQVKKHLLQVRNKLRSTESNMKPLSSQHFRGPLILKLVSLFLENYLQSLQNKNTISQRISPHFAKLSNSTRAERELCKTSPYCFPISILRVFDSHRHHIQTKQQNKHTINLNIIQIMMKRRWNLEIYYLENNFH